MKYPKTKRNTVRPLFGQTAHQRKLGQETLLKYERLSPVEKQAIQDWLQEHLPRVPFSAKVKRLGLAQLLAGNDRTPEALAIIRYAVKIMNMRKLQHYLLRSKVWH